MNTTSTHNITAQAPTDGTSDGPPPIMPALDLSSNATGAPPPTPHAALTQYEHIIEQSLTAKPDRAMALLAIVELKLYKLAHTSLGRYLAERWGMSRSRGDQLLRFAKERRSCLQNGQLPPTNERQVRRLAAHGTSRPKAPAHGSYDRYLQQVRRCLAANLANTLPGEHRRFGQDVHQMLDQLLTQALAQIQAPAGVEPIAEVGLPKAATSVTQSLKPKPQTGDTSAPESPVPPLNKGPVQGISIEQARRLGYVR